MSKFLYKNRTIIFILIIAFLFRFIWLKTTIERDEGIFGSQSLTLFGKKYLLFTNKPIILLYIYWFFTKYFENSVIYVRIFNNLLFFISTIFLYIFTKKIYDKKIAFYSALFYIILANLPALEGPLAMSESLALLPQMLFAYFLFLYITSNKKSFFILSALFLIMCILIRYNFIYLILFMLLILKIYNKKIKDELFIFTSLTLFLFLALNILALKNPKMIYDFYRFTLVSIYNYIYSQFSNTVPMQHLFFILLQSSFFSLLSILGMIFISTKNNKENYKLNEQFDLFILIWFGINLLSLYKTAFGHNFLPLIQPTSVLSAYAFEKLKKLNKKFIKVILFLILLIFFLTGYFLSILQHPNYNIRYNMFQWDYSDYESFEQQIELSNLVKNNSKNDDNIIYFGWDGSIYWLTKKINAFPMEKLSCTQLNVSREFHKKILAEEYPYEDKNKKTKDSLFELFKKIDPKFIIISKKYSLDCNFAKNLLNFAETNNYEKINIKNFLIYYNKNKQK